MTAGIIRRVRSSADEAAVHRLLELAGTRVAARLLAIVREQDTVARLGGDEFAIILRDVSSKGHVEAAIARVRGAFEQPFRVAGCEVIVRPSLGSALWPDDADDLDRLMRHADLAMYTAKRAATTRAQSRRRRGC